jgi:hypothetical protein
VQKSARGKIRPTSTPIVNPAFAKTSLISEYVGFSMACK